MLKLERPICFVDFETTGTDISIDRIIEMSFAKLNPDGSKEVKTYRVNPGIPIPKGSSEIHGITDEMVKDLPKFSSYAKGIVQFISGCDLAGFNSNKFDFPLLMSELVRCNVEWEPDLHEFIDVGNIFKIKEERTLGAAYRLYCGAELEGAHGAETDILATIDILEGQYKKYDDLPGTVSELATYSNFGNKILDLSGLFTYAEDGVTVIMGKGKHKGKLATSIDWDYWKWVYYTSDFPKDTKKIVKKYMDAK